MEHKMNCACIACFNAELENQVKNIWKQFEENNIGKTPGSFGEDPHISMFAVKNHGSDSIIENIRKFENKQINIVLLPYGVFNGEKKVIFLNVIITNELMNYRNRIFDCISNCDIIFEDFYKKDNALLHCTIALDIEDIDIAKSIQIMSTLRSAYIGYINRLQILEYFPVKKILEIK
jgi:hypothetical protein